MVDSLEEKNGRWSLHLAKSLENGSRVVLVGFANLCVDLLEVLVVLYYEF